MKTIKIFLITLCLAAGAQVAFAQENGNRDENNKIVRGPYLTNGAGGNWWINLGGGITVFGDGGATSRVTPALDVAVGKWFTPSIGVRAAYQGLTGSLWTPYPAFDGSLNADKNKYKANFGYAYAHGDFMWNISNAFSGYKETRFWDVIPYVHAGFLAIYKDGVDREFAAGAGLYNTLRLCNRVDLTLDVRGFFFNGRAIQAVGGVAAEISATLGVAINLGKTNWVRHSSVPVVDNEALARISELELANSELADEKDQLAKANDELEQANSELEKSAQELAAMKEQAERDSRIPHSQAFYFVIGQTHFSKIELARLDYYMNNSCADSDEDLTMVLTIRNDSKTGSAKRNKFLSNERMKYIKNILENKYAVNSENIRFEIVDSENPELDRCVEISFE